MRTLSADLRHAFRMMCRTPSFAVAVIIVLALGIGASSAIFSIVNAVLLRPLTVTATAVSAGFFEVVSARPALGRVFRQEEDTPGRKYVVVLSDRFWRSE